MIINFTHYHKQYSANLAEPIDISIPLRHGVQNPNCFYAPPPSFTPVIADGFIGDTRQGGSVNFYNVQYNPHGNGTHTECVGHIAKERYYINECLKQFHTVGALITLTPTKQQQDVIVTKDDIQAAISRIATIPIETLIVRTAPNTDLKLGFNYTETNPPYFSTEAMEYIVSLNIQHLVVDLPSVDREVDEGKLNAHNVFWNTAGTLRVKATITELVYIKNEIPDGLYFVNHQIPPIVLDASSSKVVLYALNELK
jgi:arylformamidase